MEDVFIVSAVRTPIGRFGGAFVDVSPATLAAHAMQGALVRAGLDGKYLDFYIIGNVLRAGHGQLIPRQAAMLAGIPEEVDGMAVDMVCSSGMMAVLSAASMIRSGDAVLVLAGGVESMSTAGFFLSSKARWGYKLLPGNREPVVDLLQYDGLTDPQTGEAMGVQAERLAAEHGITRNELDEVAVESHRRAAFATENGWFDREIFPVEIQKDGKKVVIDVDEGIRAETSLEKLSTLKPVFSKNGVLTAGNSSQISDGASALLLASASAVRTHGLTPLAKLGAGAWSAGETWRFAEAPIPAVKRVLERSGLKVADVDLFENNEAFAISNVLFSRMLDVPLDRLNVAGGAIALGHPIGASGARIMTTLTHLLHTTNLKTGLAAICHGTGGGTAVLIERV
jgi:acetyl-CoA C-acetyltransferase